jgi:hypothetical protein
MRVVAPVARRAIVGCLAVASVGVAIADGGGFDARPQWIFASFAVLAAILALAGGAASRVALSVPVAALVGLGLVGALSAWWTIGSAGEAFRWGAVALGYAALAVAYGTVVRTETVAGAIAVAAGVTGTLGLVSAAALSTAFAERVEGGWRPEGPFGYAPALALLQVFALPGLLTAMVRARPRIAMTAAAGTAVAASVLVLAGNRTAVALAALVATLAFTAPDRTVRSTRCSVGAALLLMAAAGFAIDRAAGGWHSRYEHPSWIPVGAVVAAVLGAAAVWSIVRRQLPQVLDQGGRAGGATGVTQPAALPGKSRAPLGIVVVVSTVAALAVSLGTAGSLSARRFSANDGFAHGRTWIWRVAANAALDRPFHGSGAGTFFQATILDQPGHGRVTRFAHDLPLEVAAELGIPGFLLVLVLVIGTIRAVWQAQGSSALWLSGPTAIAFLVSNSVDWTWHLAGVGAIFAAALGTLTAADAAAQQRR